MEKKKPKPKPKNKPKEENLTFRDFERMVRGNRGIYIGEAR